MFLLIAAVADSDRSFAITNLHHVSVRCPEGSVRLVTHLTEGTSLAYRMERSPVAERASSRTNLYGLYF